MKSDSKDIYNTAKDLYFKLMLFFWTFYSKITDFSFFYNNIKQHNSFQHW